MLQTERVLQERYELKQRLGNHAGRQTWLAEDLTAKPGQVVIVKLLPFSPQTHWDDLKLFEREASVLRHLNHPRIPKYRDYFAVDKNAGGGLPWFALVQDYIPGSSLQQQLESGKHFTEVQVKQIATQLLNILIELHELSPPVLHRDIKPSNIIWGNDKQVYLVDFGAVQDRAKAEGVTFTVVGTGGYAPPEQLWGRAVAASDLYALGATLIYLLTGTAPSELPQRRMRLQFQDKVNLTPHFVHWLEKLIDPALERRFSQAREALLALQEGSYPSASLEIVASGSQGTAPRARYGHIGGLGLLQYAAVALFAIALPSFLAYQESCKHCQGKQMIGIMNRSQQAYRLEKGEFSDSIPELSSGIKDATENYQYSIRTTPLSAFHYAIPRHGNLKGYVGGVFLASANDGTDELLSIAIACETHSPGLNRPVEPIVQGIVLECGSNLRSLSSSAPIVLGKDSALAYKSLSYAIGGQYEQALLIAETIDSTALKERALKAIASQSTATGQALQGAESFLKAHEVATAIKDTEIRVWVLAGIARKLAAAGYPSLAIQILSQALEVSKTLESPDTKAIVLADIARGLAAAGQPSQATRIFSQALQNAEAIGNADNQASALTYIARKYAAVGQYDPALKVAKTIKLYYGKETALEAIARELTATGQYDQALDIVQTIEDSSIKVEILTEIARNQGPASQEERIFARVLQVAQTVPFSEYQGSALEAIARELATAGRYDQTLKVIEAIQDSDEKERVLEAIARQLAAAGRYDQALNVAKTIPDNYTQERVLQAIDGYKK